MNNLQHESSSASLDSNSDSPSFFSHSELRKRHYEESRNYFGLPELSNLYGWLAEHQSSKLKREQEGEEIRNPKLKDINDKIMRSNATITEYLCKRIQREATEVRSKKV
jgi:hypothetical protein